MTLRVHQDSKMMLVMDVKLTELPSWILMWDFTPKGITGYCRYYKYINVKKGNTASVNMVLAGYVRFSNCLPYKELKHKQWSKHHRRGQSGRRSLYS